MFVLMLWSVMSLGVESAAPTLAETGVLKGKIVSTQRLKTRGATPQTDVVVYLEPVDKSASASASKETKPISVTQKSLRFEPHVLPVLIGTKVSFANADAVEHNIFSEGKCCEIDSDMGEGQSCDVTFSKAGVASIVCRLHTEMSMFVVVLETPHFVAVRLKKEKVDGKRIYQSEFEMKDIPPGKYKVKTWNKRLKAIEQEIEIKAGANDLALQLDS